MLVSCPVRAKTLGHARCHELNGRALERGFGGGHLLRDRVAIAPLGNHALHRAHLPLDAPQAPQNLLDCSIRNLKAPGFRGAARSVRARRLALTGHTAIAKQQQDETQADLAAARAAGAQAQAAVAAAAGQAQASQANVGAAQVPLLDSTVRAPFSGTITARLADVGAVVGPASPILTIEDGQNLEIDLTAPEASAAHLAAGNAVAIRVDALTNGAINGRIRAVVPIEASQAHSVLVKIAVQHVRGLLPGMYARVRLPIDTHAATAVPAAALTTRAGQDGVFAISSGRAHFIPVDTGAAKPGFIEVRGLPAATRVAVTNIERLTDNAAVSVRHR